MKHQEYAYLDALKDILENGDSRPDRTGVGTISKFGVQMRFDLQKGFPAVTTKKLAWKAVVSELLWFVEGSGDENRLVTPTARKEQSEPNLAEAKTSRTPAALRQHP